MLKNTYFAEHLGTAASVSWEFRASIVTILWRQRKIRTYFKTVVSKTRKT